MHFVQRVETDGARARESTIPMISIKNVVSAILVSLLSASSAQVLSLSDTQVTCDNRNALSHCNYPEVFRSRDANRVRAGICRPLLKVRCNRNIYKPNSPYLCRIKRIPTDS